ncbi:MAG: peptidoglycan DD-metalloendopeptidase family protein [Anaerovoracaceae bacterium]|jgi:murein DD-endopeptidase MepM/ murein hydrolase activator NlpD
MSILENKKISNIKKAIRNRCLKVKEKINTGIVDLKIDFISRLSSKTIIGIGTGAICIALVGSAFAAPTAVGHGKAETKDKVAESLQQAQEQDESYWAVMVDGKEIVALKTEDEGLEVLDGVINTYMTEGADLKNASYKEDVKVVEVPVSNEVNEILSADAALDLILKGWKAPTIYRAEKGDRLSDVASMYGMSQEEMMIANPGIRDENLLVGTKLWVYEMKPFFTTYVTEHLFAEREVKYSIVYEETDSLFKNENKVKTVGANGKNKIVTEQLIENGQIVSSKEVDTIVLKEPQNQVVLKGTRKAPSPALYGSTKTVKGSGKYCSPLARLEISSPYGASRGSGRHQGVDLRNPKGTPIMAVDSGTVVFAGYQGSYGNLIKISHGGGLETYYAHCDSMNVSVGQTVSKGQKIATVGKTGRATGYHLHFEVRINGKVQNPMNYI